MEASADLVEVDTETDPLRRHHWGGSFDHHGTILTVSDADSEHGGNVANHELSHFWLHASTPYGLFLDELAELAGHRLLGYCESLFSDGELIPVPAFRAARLSRRDPSTFTDRQNRALGKYVVPWSRDQYLEDLFEGRNTRSVREVPLYRALDYLVAFEAESSEYRWTDAELFDRPTPATTEYQARFMALWADAFRSDNPDYPAQSRILLDGGTWVPAGAQHIFEAHAQSMENAFGMEQAFYMTNEGLPYMAYFGAVLEKWRQETDIESTDAYASLLATFAIMADLALLTPVGRTYRRLRDDQMQWFDLHPGHRFRRLMEVMDKSDRVDGIDARSAAVQSELSRRLGWPRPDRFFELGASLSAVSPSQLRHASACQTRLNSPGRGVMWMLGDLNDTVGTIMGSHPPMIVLRDRCVVPGADAGTKLGYLLGYAVHRMNWMIMASGHGDLLSLEPPHLAEGGTVENVVRSGDLSQVYLDAFPFLHEQALLRVPRDPIGG